MLMQVSLEEGDNYLAAVLSGLLLVFDTLPEPDGSGASEDTSSPPSDGYDEYMRLSSERRREANETRARERREFGSQREGT